MKYSDLSDFEINKLVANKVDFGDMIVSANNHEETVYLLEKDGAFDLLPVAHFDPCNNPSDAWPIIVENGICINAMPGGDFTLWYVHDKFHTDIDIAVFDENPLRAAMIVFLMMNEGETK